SLETTLYPVETAAEILEALERARKEQDGLVLIDDALITINHKIIVEKIANDVKLPAIYGGVDGVAHGGIMAYGLQHERIFTAAGEMIDTVLRDSSSTVPFWGPRSQPQGEGEYGMGADGCLGTLDGINAGATAGGVSASAERNSGSAGPSAYAVGQGPRLLGSGAVADPWDIHYH